MVEQKGMQEMNSQFTLKGLLFSSENNAHYRTADTQAPFKVVFKKRPVAPLPPAEINADGWRTFVSCCEWGHARKHGEGE